MKLVKKIPEDIEFKITMGIPCSFKFKTEHHAYEVGFRNKFYFICSEQIHLKDRTIETINAFMASGKFYYWHVDLGVRKENKYRIGERYDVSFTRTC